MRVALLLLAAYLVGSVPSSHLAGRMAGVDLTTRGSGNLGGTNVFRVLGWRYALPVVLVDLGKGFVPAYYFRFWDASPHPEWALAYGVCAIAGHVWSVYLAFRGGKGVATSGGVLLALAPVAVALALVVWVGLVLLTRIVSVASLSAAVAVPVLAFVLDAPGETVAFAAVLTALVWWTHRENLARLRQGRELQFGAEGGDRSRDTDAGEGVGA